MKRFLTALLLCLLIPLAARAQFSSIQTDVTFQGSTNGPVSGATWIFYSGSIVQFQGATTNQLIYSINSSGTLGALGLGSGLSVSGGNLVAGSSTSANPTGTVGLTVVNGSLSSFMRSDGAPPLSQAIIPTWTGLHTFSITAVKTSGTDYGIVLTPTLNQRNAANFSLIYGDEYITQAGTGNQYLIQLQTGGASPTDQFDVTSTGAITTGSYAATTILSAYGGTGTSTFATGALLCASATNTWGVVNPGTINNVLTSNGSGVQPGYQPITTILDTIGSEAQGAVLERGSSAWQFLFPGASGTVLMSNGTTSDESFQGPLSQIFTTTGDMVYSSSGTTAGRLAIGTTGQFLEVSGGIPTWSTFSGLSNPMTTTGDIIIAGSGGTPNRLAQGSNGQFLGVSGGTLGYYTPGGTTGANPSATIGLSTVNGSATTFMRSDGAPPLGQAIVPTWTGLHTWNANGEAIALVTTGTQIFERITVGSTFWDFGMGLGQTSALEIYSTSFGDCLYFTWSNANATFGSTTAATNKTTAGATFAGGIGVALTSYMSELNLVPATRSSGVVPYFSLTIPADTGITASTEGPGFQTVTGTRTWATTGTVSVQREYLFVAPTYASASASQTFTNAATLDITGAPIAGTNAIITNPWALRIEAGPSTFGGTIQHAGLTRTTTTFNSTSSTVLANVTGLTTGTLIAGANYHFRASLPCTGAAVGGVQFAIAGTATATFIQYQGIEYSSGAIISQNSASALGSAVNSSAAAITTGLEVIDGQIQVNAAGTLTVQFAQNTSNATSSTISQGATFDVFQTTN